MGQDSVADIATCYGLDGPGIESWWGEIFCTTLDRSWGPPSLLYNGCRVSFPGKAVEAWRWPPTPYNTELTIWAFMACCRMTCTSYLCTGGCYPLLPHCFLYNLHNISQISIQSSPNHSKNFPFWLARHRHTSGGPRVAHPWYRPRGCAWISSLNYTPAVGNPSRLAVAIHADAAEC
jgi:hypothetical protein